MLPINNIVIEFDEVNAVRIRHKLDFAGTSVKTITFKDLCEAIRAAQREVSKEEVEIIDTPVLPVSNSVQTIQHRKLSNGSEYFLMVRQPGKFDIQYFDDTYKEVGIPKLVFAIKLFKSTIQQMFIVVVKDHTVTEDSQLYYYPFSNVSSYDTKVCFGSNRISELNIDSPIKLHSVIDMFLSMPNNNDSYGQNLSGLEYRPLLEALNGKNFDNSWLKPMNKTYKEWLTKLI
jgi:hypothetical protein